MQGKKRRKKKKEWCRTGYGWEGEREYVDERIPLYTFSGLGSTESGAPLHVVFCVVKLALMLALALCWAMRQAASVSWDSEDGRKEL